MTNPLLDFSGLPRFDAIRAEHVAPAVDSLLAEAETAVERAREVEPVGWETFVEPLQDATERLGRAWGQVTHLQSVMNTPEIREAYNAALPKVTRFFSALAQDQALYAQYRALAAAPEFEGFDAARRKAVENALRDFRLGGAELADEERARFAEVQQELASLSAKFSENLLDATDAFALYVEDEAELAGLPADVLAACAAAAREDGRQGWKLTLHMPCYLPVLTYADSRDLRETLYRAYGVRASESGPAELDNSDNIERILALRAELAALLGFDSYAEVSLATKMAKTPDEVLGFLRELAGKAKPHAQRDRAELQAFARGELGLESLEPWDLAWASEKLRQSRYSYSALEVKQYFTEPEVLGGLFALIQDLYGLKVEQDEAPTWHEDVRFHRLVDARIEIPQALRLDLVLQLRHLVCGLVGIVHGEFVVAVENRLFFRDAQHDVLAYGLCRIELRFLRKKADLRAVGGPRLAVKFLVDAGHDAEQGGFARAVDAENADLGVRIEGQMDIIQNLLAARPGLGQTAHMVDELTCHVGASSDNGVTLKERQASM